MLESRPPVVTIMGHVDHGKTSILDRIRQSDVAAKEVGEITQAIGAYQITWKGKKITFLDTPGHEAFLKMRSRGVRVADFVVLVVAANDGVMPQTKESIKIISEAKTPFLVAINKVDLPEASVDKVKGQLAENGILVEGYGGKTVVVPISAKTGQGIDQLLEMILLTAEMEELKADPEGELQGEIIETKKDQDLGSLITVIVKNGTLYKGDLLESEGIYGKAKLIRDDKGKVLDKAVLSQPVEIFGLEGLPPVGAKICRPKAGIQNPKEEETASTKTPAVDAEKEKSPKLKIILKADSQGSLEAVLESLSSEVEIISSGVGDINDSDILLAKDCQAKIFGFNIRLTGSVKKLAEVEKVKVFTFQIIYDLLKQLEEMVLKMMEPTIDRTILGKAEIIAEFGAKETKIAGAKVISGRINKGDLVGIERAGKIVVETKIKSLKHQSADITQADNGMEFGVIFVSPVDFQKGDYLIAWQL